MSDQHQQVPAHGKDLLVLVLHLDRGVQATEAGIAVKRMIGVKSVAVDPERRQLIARYDAQLLSAGEIRAALRPELPPTDEDAWFALLPTIAHALPLAATLL